MMALDWGRGTWDKVLTIIVAVALLGAIGVLGYILAGTSDEEKYTEFYMLGLSGKAADYPGEVKAGEDAKVIVGVVNHEREVVSYLIEVRIGDTMGNWVGPLELGHDEKWEEVINFTPDSAGEGQKVEFVLYKNGEREPYLNLHLRINVKE